MTEVKIEPISPVFPPAYISTTSKIIVNFKNVSDEVQNICIKSTASEDEEKNRTKNLDLFDPTLRGIASDKCIFKTDAFNFDTVEFELWPNGSRSAVLYFTPPLAKKYDYTAYVSVNNNPKRTPIKMSGTGLPPEAMFVQDSIQIGHVGLGTSFQYRVDLKNTGKVDIEFQLEEHDTEGLTFQFHPSKGRIGIGQSIPIDISFFATKVRAFNETFVFRVRGATRKHPFVTLTGKVVGPSYQISPRIIDFGNVSFGFLYTRKFVIENKSELPFNYTLKTSFDGSLQHRELEIYPQKGTVPKFGSVEVNLELIPVSIRTYTKTIFFGIDNFGDTLVEIPIHAVCVAPSLSLDPETIDMGKVFIGHSYTKSIYVVNSTDYSAKFEYVPQNSMSQKLGEVTVSKEGGIVDPQSKSEVPISLLGKMIGPIDIKCFIKVFGSDDPPLPFHVVANCTGPTISYSTHAIRFGNIGVLSDETRPLIITNSSLIGARFKAAVEQSDKIFDVEPYEGEIGPGKSAQLNVKASVNDVLAFSGKLKVTFDYLTPQTISITAKGIGSPITSTIPMDVIDFGYILTETPATASFQFTNVSKRTYEVRFTMNKPRTTNDSKDISVKVFPEYVSLASGETAWIEVTAHCSTVENFTVQMQCHATVGRARTEIYNTQIKGSFVQPLISFSAQQLDFEQATLPMEDRRDLIQPPISIMQSITKDLIVTNQSQIPLEVLIDCPEYFKINTKKFIIDSKKEEKIMVTFDPSFKEDFNTETIQKKLTFSISNHPHKMTVNLKAVLQFPNLSFDCEKDINFGVMMTNTENSKTINIKSEFSRPVEFQWELHSNDDNAIKVFDIFPLRGIIEPEQSLPTHFSFFARGDPNGKSIKYHARAVCHVSSGPDYEFFIKGRSATIQYKIEDTHIDFGKSDFLTPLTKTTVLENTSSVSIKYNVKIPKRTKLGSFTVSPAMGVIKEKESQELTINITPGSPGLFNEIFTVQIGTFEDIHIEISVDATFMQISSSLPRSKDDPASVDLRAQKLANIEKSSKRLDAIKTSADPSSDDDQENDQEVGIELNEEELLEFEKKTIHNFITRKYTPNFTMRGEQTSPIVARYDCDFGEIILGENISKQFTIKSRASFPMSFTIDTSELRRTGFKIEPVTFKDIPPESDVTIEASFVVAQRRNNSTGEVSFDIPLIFPDDHRVIVTVMANLKIPKLGLSQLHFDFEQVIIGQTKIMTLQLQNMNSVNCDFQFGSPSLLDSIKSTNGENNDKEQEVPIFQVIPDNGTLPPSSYINIAIHFTPDSEKNYQMQFPLKLKHAPEPDFITVSGSGAQLMLHFNPSELELPPVMPFSSPSQAMVTVINPTDYPIDFYSLQFDAQLNAVEESADLRETESPFVTYTPKLKAPKAAAKFSMCVIVDGPPTSGKTTLARNLEKKTGMTVIKLKDVWKDATDRVQALHSLVSDPKYRGGIIIDGLNGFEDSAADESFLQQVYKTKKDVFDNPNKQINTIYQSSQLSTYQQTVEDLCYALDGHYVFHILLKVSQEEINARQEKLLAKERRANRKHQREERDRYINMIEEEYLALSEEERAEVDRKRAENRNKIAAAIIKAYDETNENEAANGKGKRKKREEVKESSRKPKEAEKVEKKGKGKSKNPIPSDPFLVECLISYLSSGWITQKLAVQTDRFKVIEPSTLGCYKLGSLDSQRNTLFLDGHQKQSKILEESMSFVPPINILKEHAFKLMIPEASVVDSVAATEAMRLSKKIPQFFSIICETPQSQVKIKKGSEEVPQPRQMLTTRWHIDGGQEMQLAIKFDPVSTFGNLSDQLLFGIERSSTPAIPLRVKGISAIPDFDRAPKNFFKKVLKNFDQNQAPHYILSSQTLAFGYVLICKERQAKAPAKYQSILSLSNTSEFPAEVTMIVDQQPKQTTWFVEPSSFTVNPGEKQEVTVGFNPTAAQEYNTKLSIYIKENPEPMFVNLWGECVNPGLLLSTTVIDFDKVLTGSDRTRKIELKNQGKLPAFWRIKNPSSITSSFDFSATEGTVLPNKAQSLSIKFTAAKNASIKKNFVLEVLDSLKSHVFESYNIPISGEAFDVSFDVTMPKGSGQEQLEFGLLKVGQTKSLQILLKNKGKYPVQYKAALDSKLARMITLNPPEAVIAPNEKNPMITATVAATTSCNFHINRGLSITLIDTQTKAVTTKLFYPVVVQASYNSFTTSCAKVIDFKTNSVGATETSEFVVTNTGPFPFDFEIRGKPDQNEATDRKGAANKAKPAKKGPVTGSVTNGSYTVAPAGGNLAPGSSITIQASFCPTAPGQTSAKFALCVPETGPTYSVSTFKCQGTAFKPELNTASNDKVFPKLPLCIRVDLARKDMTCYVEDEQILHFQTRVVTKKESVTVALINKQPIPCPVEVGVKPKGKGSCPFEVSEKSFVIPANETKRIIVTFSPQSAESFSAIFEAVIKGGSTFKFGIEGSGTIPSITLLTPLDKSKSGFAANLGKTFVGSEKIKRLAFLNDRPVPVVMTVAAKASPDFEVVGIEKPITVDPNQQFILNVLHKPQKVRKGQLELNISVADNPKFSIPISISGEGYTEDVVFEGLGDDNELQFSSVVVGCAQSIVFSMTNVSDSDLRFIWNAAGDITFSPKVGHLRRGATKEITATFFSEKATKIAGGKGGCQITKIAINSEVDWDDSKKVVQFVKRSEIEAVSPRKGQPEGPLVRVNTVEPEPAYTPVPGSKSREIPIRVFVVADVIKYTLDQTEIAFAPTMMYQTRTTEVKLANTSSIRIEYEWVLQRFESLRTDYAGTKPPVFTIEPRTGFIEPGSASTFSVMFSPLEVDDFKGRLVCSIAYMPGDPPVVDVSGISRRPLCHINSGNSDYLQHRHPDFTYPLPEGTKVIEVFAKGVGSRALKKIEVINPTSEPYETSWRMRQDSSNGSITCTTPNALVSSGKTIQVIFSFLPRSSKLVESLFEFEIPSKGIKVPFLIVGRISH